jgi:hypothetical protein
MLKQLNPAVLLLLLLLLPVQAHLPQASQWLGAPHLDGSQPPNHHQQQQHPQQLRRHCQHHLA